MSCYVAQYPNKKSGPCKYLNVFGPLGCDCERDDLCYNGPDVKLCSCPRCSGEGYEADFICSSYVPQYRTWGPEDKEPGNCNSCKYANLFGKHGCPLCDD